MTANLHLGDESKVYFSNPYGRHQLKSRRAMSPTPNDASQDHYREVPLAEIAGQRHIQTRVAFDPQHDDEDQALVDSLASEGQLVPVLLAQSAGGDTPQYSPLDGHRRIAGLRLLGRATVRAFIVRAATRECDLISLTANVRKNLTPLELAEALARLENEHKLKPDDIARRVGLTRSYVWKLRRLSAAPPAVREAVAAKRITAHVADALLRAPEEHQQAALDLAVNCQLSEPQVERVLEACAKNSSLTPEQAAQALKLISAPSVAPSPPAPVAAKQDKSNGQAGELTQEAIVAYIQEVFPEVTSEQAAGVAELAVDHDQPRKIVKAACLLLLSNWEPVRAIEGAELSERDPQVRRVVNMLDLCLELEAMLRSETKSRECAPMLVGLMRRLLATKRLALKFEKE
ncbi:MAG: ParB/RepB/Spo0J family partition protein [Anaerolineales bacterium]|nr:ParB/RepB/Spo0J family partition protein [Anaerolineales bacterium]